MSASNGSSWHTANGAALPFRPPTVEEALPYSPFSSIVPFSSDIIPFPSAKPPTPPTTLTPEQQDAAKKAVGILDAEIRGPLHNSQHLQPTLLELQSLLNPADLSQFRFKSQLVTPPPDSPTSKSVTNGSTNPKIPALSYFANMLLKNTDVSHLHSGNVSAGYTRPNQVSLKQSSFQPPARSITKPVPVTTDHPSYNQTSSVQFQSSPSSPSASTTSQRTTNTPTRPGPAVIISKQPSAQREEYQRYDHIQTDDGLSKKRKREGNEADNEALSMRSQQREIADQKTNELLALIATISEAKEFGDESGMFATITTDESEFSVLESDTLKRLSTAVMNVIRSGTFPNLPREEILRIQALIEPSIAATSRLSTDPTEGETQDWLSSLEKANSGLRACRLVLETMTKGGDEQRICSEDLVRIIIAALKHILDSCLIPIVESRRQGSSSELFDLASQAKNAINPSLTLCGTVLGLLAKLIGKVTLTETALTPIEYVSTGIIFVQNGENEKESALGIQKFELFRSKAMDVLAQIFACHLDQRSFILNEILSNLEKLPEKRGSARQFKLAHGVPIMLVSALFMRIVQAAASKTTQEKRTNIQAKAAGISEEEEEDSDYGKDNHSPTRKPKPTRDSQRVRGRLSQHLVEDSKSVATKIATFLVDRAISVSKSGDKPFRTLLDLFIEDFCNVLGSPEWPAAVVILRQLCARMYVVIPGNKESSVNDKFMALTDVGIMACGITEFRSRMKHHRRTLDVSQSEISDELVRLADDVFSNGINNKDLLAFDGPHRIVLESLQDYMKVGSREDPHFQAVNGCHITYWDHAFCNAFLPTEGETEPLPRTIELLGRNLNKMVHNPEWLHDEFESQGPPISDSQSQLAAGIITMQDPFCQVFPRLVKHLIDNASSNPSPKLKSRAMTSLSQLIEKDPKTLDEQTFNALNTLVSDSSPMVRENVLAMISKCLEHNPSLERLCLKSVLQLVDDPATGPKKRAIKILKDMYLGSVPNERKLDIACHLLVPVLDDDKGVSDLTHQTLEDIWLAPPNAAARVDENQLRLDRRNRVSMLVQIVQKVEEIPNKLEAFESFFSSAVSNKAKNPTANFTICRELVADMVEGVIGTDLVAGENSQARILNTLSIFAKVSPRLFTSAQVQLLKPYVKDLATTDDLKDFRPTLVIFRHVFPALPSLQESFLEEVRSSLLPCTGKLANWAAQHSAYKSTLLDVAHCLWTVSPLVTNGVDKLLGLICSAMAQSQLLRSSTKNQALTAKDKLKIITYLLIMGVFGRVCDFDKHIDLFRGKLTTVLKRVPSKENSSKLLTEWKGNSVPILLQECVRPFTMQPWDMSVREHALGSLGEICQNSPSLFTRADVKQAFKLVFLNENYEDNTELRRVVLTQFREFFSTAERRSESGAEIAVGEGAVRGSDRLDSSFVASDNDTAPLHLGPAFLSDIVAIALGNPNDLALIATDIIISISRQGIVHPKECGPALVALSSSSNLQLASKATAEHQSIHLKNERMFEKEYMAAVALAFKYQRDVANDPHGARDKTFKPKLQRMNEVLKSGTPKIYKKFLMNMCKKMDFDLSKLDTSNPKHQAIVSDQIIDSVAEGGSHMHIPDVLLFARFCLENLGFFDYAHIDEVQVLILTIHDIVLKHTGPSVALAIENEISKPHLELEQPPVGLDINGEGSSTYQAPQNPTASPIPEARLRQITVASMILQMMWDTRAFLRKQWNMLGKITITTKDANKSAVKNNLISGKELWEKFENVMSALENTESMTRQCLAFGRLIEVDLEAKVGDEDLDASEQLARAAAGYETPDDNGAEDDAPPTSGRGRKRKSESRSSNTPKKPRGRLTGSKVKKTNSRTPEGDDDWD
ncbi:uncharacterized protein BDR25DRAFT_256887 [Lindgomyces ingoldianus]|uniref:Uncharacterized protein n=1 Tax=Lindgomyces ingoldianus TaxID=673940 RepID=A0ACB6R419_9PLEO|nr:uncharacterized protein BDR25DRAFT_256887 [Lindgomyces ingoldianus]KAF2473891.1 hypothetical protein BDR25DRAFT_256887 [Lindgomyces ingoldianus]